MDFDLSEEQRLLKESVDGLLTDAYDFEQRKKYMAEKGGWSKASGASSPSRACSACRSPRTTAASAPAAVETMIVMEALGRALVLEPYLATVVLGGGFLRHGGIGRAEGRAYARHHRRQQDLRLRAAREEVALRSADVATTAKKKGDGWVIDGEKFVVLNGDGADTLVVTARTKGGQRDKTASACSWCRATPRASSTGLSDPGRPACRRHHVHRRRGRRRCRDRRSREWLPLIERVVDEARTAMCAEAVGAMDESLKTTVEYLKTRKQFGVPIGSFQTLQHRAADMFVALEQARSMAMFATMASDFDERQGARHRGRRRQGADRQVRKVRRPAGDPAARRHRHDHGRQDRPLFQAPDHDREHLRRHRLSPAPRHRGGGLI